MKSLLIKAMLPVLVVALAFPVIAAAADLSSNADYKTKCTACHGANGEGKAAMKTKPLSEAASKSDADLTKIIENGMPNTTMKGYKDKLSKDQIAGLVKSIKAQKK